MRPLPRPMPAAPVTACRRLSAAPRVAAPESIATLREAALSAGKERIAVGAVWGWRGHGRQQDRR
jgi:hypothetical protein